MYPWCGSSKSGCDLRSVSDLCLLRSPSLDLLLGCDLVVSTAPQIMGTYAPGRTRAVINDHVVPIALFTRQPDMPIQAGPLTRRIGGSIAPEDTTRSLIAAAASKSGASVITATS